MDLEIGVSVLAPLGCGTCAADVAVSISGQTQSEEFYVYSFFYQLR